MRRHRQKVRRVACRPEQSIYPNAIFDRDFQTECLSIIAVFKNFFLTSGEFCVFFPSVENSVKEPNKVALNSVIISGLLSEVQIRISISKGTKVKSFRPLSATYCLEFVYVSTRSLELCTLKRLKMELESMARYISPVNPAVFPHLTIVLLGIGIFFTAWFFVYEVTSTKYTRDIFKELVVALFAAIFSGMGVLFLMLWVGIYV
ncbi:uncharacterized protein LOC113209289 [Frankliniella occidentalis]|uniref:Dolichyl-diphosphooligosaccharide-protein glycosyltransferase subunit TMEM258 n=1 Tax=Frankliniella occidentalis TaxID=133901 RepID=A0A6J1SNY7_FRAOC|nr:uncharacterized protein LOC113209289 [Frankliniella occidentalis]